VDILLVDHEAYRTASLARGLRIMGYHVFEAGTLREAVDFIRRQDVSIHLIITDCSTRILYHPEMIAAVRENIPHAQLVMMTDLSKWNADAPSSWPWPTHFIHKPFTLVQLVYLIGKLRSQSSRIVIPGLGDGMAVGMEGNPSDYVPTGPNCQRAAQ
jgi:DNA-binding NtrC family response regulator